MKIEFQTELLSKYRNELMGFAIIWILFYHFKLSTPILATIASVGYTGVDIFMFLSGFGLCYSLYKNPVSYKQYVIKRFKRIFPLYVTVGALLSLFVFHDSVGMWLWKSSTIGFWTNGEFYEWFVPSIVFCYVIFPIVYWLLFHHTKLYWAIQIGVFLLPIPLMVLGKCGF